jgi:UPF0716 protein FxsA
MVPLLLLLIFIVVPLAELYVIIQVGQAIGVLPTIAILLADSIIGSVLLRTQGRSAWRRFMAAVSEGRVPTREVLEKLPGEHDVRAIDLDQERRRAG